MGVIKMSKFGEALHVLGIKEYEERILHSNSRGELFHIDQYFDLANIIGTTEWFPKWFRSTVDHAEKEWNHPESVFQHTLEILKQQIKVMEC